VLASAGRAAKITYLDLSTAARGVAEARAAARGLTNIEFHTGSLLDARVSVNSTTSTVAACSTISRSRRRGSTRWRVRWRPGAGSA
jgi:hypothetical protein